MITGKRTVMSSVITKTPTAARYFPITIPVMDRGLVISSLSVFWRVSSEISRMVRMGTGKRKMNVGC